METINLGILISGRGSNLEAIIDACEKGQIAAKVAVVVSNKADALGLEHAKKHKIPFAIESFSSKEEYEAAIIKALERQKADLVCLAGYMKIVGHTLLGKYKGRMLNIHPALLPSFPGLNAQKQALDYGVKISGCTVHFVDEGCDTGPIILQKVVPVLDDDTEETLSARILEQEHKAYPEAIDLVAQGKIKIYGRRVKIYA
jgi:phosphoribosylglycinamide formyltransferase-1